MQRWKDKVAVVTGASAGIGRAVAAKLAEEGMRVVAVARRKEKLQKTYGSKSGESPVGLAVTTNSEVVCFKLSNACSVFTGEATAIKEALAHIHAAHLEKSAIVSDSMSVLLAIKKELADQYKGKVYPFPCDITKDQEVVSLFKKIETIGPCHVLVNNAGTAYYTSVLGCNLEHWRYMFDLNVIALGLATREAIASMKMNGIDDGYIINISSISSHGMPEGIGKHVYNATKHAVRVLTEGARMELAQKKSGIKISTICPGVVETEIFDVGGWGGVYTKDDLPMLDPKAIADAAVTLLSTPHSTHIADLVVRPLGEKIMA